MIWNRVAGEKNKREEILEIMEEIIPWEEWVAIIRPYYPTGKRGRPHRSELMLRMYLAGQVCSTCRSGTEDAIYELRHAEVHRDNFMKGSVPDETKLLNFRHLLEEHRLKKSIF